ncbi:hypothetical protein ASPZODRAFT_2119063 [Penicilliopsis zonata CBS 506.65]|uniref:xylan 1,4-beta-xylosidase n=1 Tax=Penicilliopsis zonata CBS 506.65 TaxID=1073090 RepID=A0A1L9S6J2_9EURO|nr:hypothetical protein ASPZODRAFT_2119063 [Penicilliopsis zonata CBS 506.65]OJJ42779.1 hypothetical protein ASPZODRAFT_2119063 [Penicilliopsis zonata CBS 506.65]
MSLWLFLPLVAAAPTSSSSSSSSSSSCGKPLTVYNASITHLGCYTDATGSTLTGINSAPDSFDAPQFCADWCGELGYQYSGVQTSYQCFCGDEIGSSAVKVNESLCDYACPADASATCGGDLVMDLYKVNNAADLPSHSLPFTAACEYSPLCSTAVCDTSLSIADRVKALVSAMTVDEKVNNVISVAAGAARLGLPAYEWWSEALHGVAGSPGVGFRGVNGSAFSYATSFPMPILMAAAFDNPLISRVAAVIGREARAFANQGFAGFDFWTPNINPFRDPRWGRGAETPGEDPFHIQEYVRQLIPGLQGDHGNAEVKQIIATCKHFAVYDIETDREGNNLDPTQQDLGDFYLPSFKTCVRDVHVGSVMCSYNGVDGIPSCANEYLLRDMLRETYNFTGEYNYVVADCDAVANIYSPHSFTDSTAAAAAVALNAGTDLDCGYTYRNLTQALAAEMTTEATLDQALSRLYSALFTVGYFDGDSPYTGLAWKDVNTGHAQVLAYEAAVEGMTLLKNDGLLPLNTAKYPRLAVVGPWANATTQMQGSYEGVAPYLHSPLTAFSTAWETVEYALGTNITDTSTAGFAAAVAIAEEADLVLYLGGIDQTVEGEGWDRSSIVWPGNQLDLVSALADTGKPLVVVQFGGGQIDDTALLANDSVNALVWAGYPGQDGGYALLDVLTGKKSIAGRLPVTQYPAKYVDQVSLYDMNLRPNASASFPGRTYKWYTGDAVVPFGFGLHYTDFAFEWASTLKREYQIADLLKHTAEASYTDLISFATLSAIVENIGRGKQGMASDYVGLLFLSTTNAGPAPYAKRELVAFDRAHSIPVHGRDTLVFNVSLGSLARTDVTGDLVLYPGDYTLTLDIDARLSMEFSLKGEATVIETLPRQREQTFTVPVHIQAAST